LAPGLRTRRDLAKRLAGRGYPAAVIEQVLSRLTALGLVNDGLYAEGFIRRRLRLRPRSPAMLRLELRSRGVAETAIETAMEAFAGELDEVALARDALRRQAYRWAKLDPEAARRRAIGVLRRLAFSAAVILEAVQSTELFSQSNASRNASSRDAES
jgi:regulatory protein